MKRKLKLAKKHKPLMERWIKDLKQNPELQGDGFLKQKDEEQYCCLGRLCLLAGVPKEAMEELGEPSELSNANFMKIPIEFARVTAPGVDVHTLITNMLVGMNDDMIRLSSETDNKMLEYWGFDLKQFEYRTYTFSEIADYLEEIIEYE